MLALTTSRRRLAALALGAGVVGLVALVLSTVIGAGSDDEEEEAKVKVNPYLDRVPTFAPAPEPDVVTLPEAGPGEVPVVHRVPTTQPVAFITVDDGVVREPDARLLLEAAGVPVSVFPVTRWVEEDPDFFVELMAEDATMQAHSISHPSLEAEPVEVQAAEICGSVDRLEALLGQRPTLFRPPYGAYDDTTLEVAADCGMRAVVHWRVTVDYGEIAYQPAEDSVQPGDILLLHFRADFADDFLVALDAIAEAGLTPARLEDYL